MADYYESLAADYDWIFDDDALANGLAINHPATARLLASTSHGQRSCWTRPAARALTRRRSPAAAIACGPPTEARRWPRRPRAGSGSEQLEIPLARSLWADLPAAVGERFDVVLCIGNSLVHAAGRDAMIQALTGLREMVRPGGHVVVDSRNWEKLHAEHRVVQLADRAVTRHGRRCIVLYAWEIPDRLDQEHVAHIVLIFDDGDRLEPREYRIGFSSLHGRRTAGAAAGGRLAGSR